MRLREKTLPQQYNTSSLILKFCTRTALLNYVITPDGYPPSRSPSPFLSAFSVRIKGTLPFQIYLPHTRDPAKRTRGYTASSRTRIEPAFTPLTHEHRTTLCAAQWVSAFPLTSEKLSKVAGDSLPS
jgi:hypothetical protein